MSLKSFHFYSRYFDTIICTTIMQFCHVLFIPRFFWIIYIIIIYLSLPSSLSISICLLNADYYVRERRKSLMHVMDVASSEQGQSAIRNYDMCTHLYQVAWIILIVIVFRCFMHYLGFQVSSPSSFFFFRHPSRSFFFFSYLFYIRDITHARALLHR